MGGYAYGLSETCVLGKRLWPDLLLWTGTNHRILQHLLLKLGYVMSIVLFWLLFVSHMCG